MSAPENPQGVAKSYVSQVVEWIDRHPEEWALDRGHFRLVHKPSGVALWIANGAYGISIEIRGREVWGGSFLLSTFGLSVQHWRLWFAYKRWLKHVAGDDLFARAKDDA